METRHLITVLTGAVMLLFSVAASAQIVPEYGANITQDQASKVIAAAITEAKRIKVPMAVAVVDTGGHLVAFTRIDDTLAGSVAISQDKAVSATLFRRPTKAFQDAVASGAAGTFMLNLRGASTVEGGIPLTAGSKLIGAIGVSGGSPEEDGVVAKAGVTAISAN